MGLIAWLLLLFASLGVLVAAAIGVFVLLYVRPERLQAMLRPPPPHELGTEKFVRAIAQVVSTVNQTSGQIEVQGELWEARSAHPAHHFSVGARVMIVGVRGTLLIVIPPIS